MMAQQQHEIYYDYPPNRSPSSTRGFPPNHNGLTRQTSRHFETFNQLPSLYTGDDMNPGHSFDNRYDNRTMGMPAPNAYSTQTWNYGVAPSGLGSVNMGNATGRLRPANRRGALPTQWTEPQQPPSLSLSQMGMNGMGAQQFYQDQLNGLSPNSQNMAANQQGLAAHPRPEDNIIVQNGEELISTAIVIKNIPFAVKKEYLIELMTRMHLPLPYAFNYHFDNGVFRGLAFANFTSAEETREVITAMNHMDLQGRKLRVEYKKMLPQAERDRIEREKRERRGQLEEQHQPMPSGTLHTQTSMSSLNSAVQPATSPSPVSMRSNISKQRPFVQSGPADPSAIDMNDPETLSFYTELAIFLKDNTREMMIFPSDTSPTSRRKIHVLAHSMGLTHRSKGTGSQRHLRIYKHDPGDEDEDLLSATRTTIPESQRRGLNRAATIDFSDARANDSMGQHTLGRQGSGYLDIPSSPGLGMTSSNTVQNLRGAKSFADLRSYTPSPVASTASFPAGLSQNISRFNDYAAAPVLTPASSGHFMNRDNESFMINGMGNLSLGGFDRTGNGRMNNRRMDRETHNPSAVGGAIGSQRPSANNSDDKSRSNGASAPERQPIGPSSEWSSGFSRPRQNGHVGRGSGELDFNGADLAQAD